MGSGIFYTDNKEFITQPFTFSTSITVNSATKYGTSNNVLTSPTGYTPQAIMGVYPAGNYPKMKVLYAYLSGGSPTWYVNIRFFNRDTVSRTFKPTLNILYRRAESGNSSDIY